MQQEQVDPFSQIAFLLLAHPLVRAAMLSHVANIVLLSARSCVPLACFPALLPACQILRFNGASLTSAGDRLLVSELPQLASLVTTVAASMAQPSILRRSRRVAVPVQYEIRLPGVAAAIGEDGQEDEDGAETGAASGRRSIMRAEDVAVLSSDDEDDARATEETDRVWEHVFTDARRRRRGRLALLRRRRREFEPERQPVVEDAPDVDAAFGDSSSDGDSLDEDEDAREAAAALEREDADADANAGDLFEPDAAVQAEAGAAWCVRRNVLLLANLARSMRAEACELDPASADERALAALWAGIERAFQQLLGKPALDFLGHLHEELARDELAQDVARAALVRAVAAGEDAAAWALWLVLLPRALLPSAARLEQGRVFDLLRADDAAFWGSLGDVLSRTSMCGGSPLVILAYVRVTTLLVGVDPPSQLGCINACLTEFFRVAAAVLAIDRLPVPPPPQQHQGSLAQALAQQHQQQPASRLRIAELFQPSRRAGGAVLQQDRALSASWLFARTRALLDARTPAMKELLYPAVAGSAGSEAAGASSSERLSDTTALDGSAAALVRGFWSAPGAALPLFSLAEPLHSSAIAPTAASQDDAEAVRRVADTLLLRLPDFLSALI